MTAEFVIYWGQQTVKTAGRCPDSGRWNVGRPAGWNLSIGYPDSGDDSDIHTQNGGGNTDNTVCNAMDVGSNDRFHPQYFCSDAGDFTLMR
jgi:hypothetical protein